MRRRIPIAKKLLVMVLTTSAVLSTLLTVVQIAFEYKEKRSQQNGIISGIKTSLVPSVGQRMWDYDLAAIQDQLRGMLLGADVSSIQLVSDAGKTIFDESREGFAPKYPNVVKFTVTHEDLGAVKEIGTLSMTFYSDRIVEEIRFHFITLLGFNMLKTLIVALILSYLFGRTVARPLTQIVEYFAAAERAKQTAERPELMVSRSTGTDDELTDVIEYIRAHDLLLYQLQDMQKAKIENQEKALEESDEALKQERMRAEMSARVAQLAEMASGIAHEINNPLAIISGYVSLAKRECGKPTPNPANIVANMDKAAATIQRITRIVTGLRSFARDARHDPMSTASVGEIIEDTLSLVSSRVTANGVNMKVENSSDAFLSIECRKVQIVQILVALINNAFDAIKGDESPWIRLTVGSKNGQLTMRIVDSGRGIPADVAARIFDPFFTTKEVGNGTGLGLSVALGLARDHHGELNLLGGESHTTFELLVPLSQPAAAPASKSA